MLSKLDPRLAALGLRASGVVGAVGLAFLVGMFASFAAGARSTGMTLGWINDVTGVITLPLALPGVLVLHQRMRARAGAKGDALLLVGIGAGGTIVALQLLLVSGVVDVRGADRAGHRWPSSSWRSGSCSTAASWRATGSSRAAPGSGWSPRPTPATRSGRSGWPGPSRPARVPVEGTAGTAATTAGETASA